MTRRRLPQTRTEQQQILAAAQADGTLPTLYWYVVCGDDALTIGGPDGAAVPVMAAGPDVETQRHWAHLMLEVAQSYHPKRTLRLELTAVDLLDATGAWIAWSEIDHVCPSCAAVNGDCVCVPMREVGREVGREIGHGGGRAGVQ